MPWFGVEQVEALHRERPSVAEGRRGFRFEDELHLRGEFAHRLQAEREGHAAAGAEGVHREREGGDDTVDGRFFKKQRLAAVGGFHLAVGPRADLQLRGDRRADAPQLPGLVERGEEGGEGFVGHEGS